MPRPRLDLRALVFPALVFLAPALLAVPVLVPVFLAAPVLLATPTTLAGQEPPGAPDDASARLAELLAEHRYEVTLAGDTLGGAGGRLLNEEGRAARFALLGEEHGIAEIPELATAWFRGLIPAGYRRLAVEVGPDAGALLDSLAAEGLDAVGAFQRAHAPGFPFFILRSEARLLVEARRALPGEPEVVWGIDYDILGDRYLFDALEAAAPDEAARAVVREIRADADAAVADLLRTGNPGRLLLWSAPDEPFERLRAALAPEPGSRVDRILETWQETAAINRLFLSGSNWESNRRRAAWLKRSMARHLAAEEGAGAGARRVAEERAGAGARRVAEAGDRAPRVMVKLGSNHLYRGLNVTRQYDVGAMLAQLATAAGERSFHLLVIGGPGARQAVFNPVEFSYGAQPATALAGIAAGAPFDELALEGGWTLFDLRPLRPALHEGRVPASDALLDLAFNFDAVLLIGGGTPAEPFFDPGAALRGEGGRPGG